MAWCGVVWWGHYAPAHLFVGHIPSVAMSVSLSTPVGPKVRLAVHQDAVGSTVRHQGFQHLITHHGIITMTPKRYKASSNYHYGIKEVQWVMGLTSWPRKGTKTSWPLSWHQSGTRYTGMIVITYKLFKAPWHQTGLIAFRASTHEGTKTIRVYSKKEKNKSNAPRSSLPTLRRLSCEQLLVSRSINTKNNGHHSERKEFNELAVVPTVLPTVLPSDPISDQPTYRPTESSTDGSLFLTSPLLLPVTAVSMRSNQPTARPPDRLTYRPTTRRTDRPTDVPTYQTPHLSDLPGTRPPHPGQIHE